MDITGTFRKEIREFDGRSGWGGFTGVEKIKDFGWRMIRGADEQLF